MQTLAKSDSEKLVERIIKEEDKLIFLNSWLGRLLRGRDEDYKLEISRSAKNIAGMLRDLMAQEHGPITYVRHNIELYPFRVEKLHKIYSKEIVDKFIEIEKKLKLLYMPMPQAVNQTYDYDYEVVDSTNNRERSNGILTHMLGTLSSKYPEAAFNPIKF
ncbi:MAG: hypothetical protein LVQ97_00610 [Candidatus Micrarchaeales archaeon]|jgi:hypothetical protein|uniref:Uncharacterized protein n=1 Tax=Candidatus Micrarchaeum acidiphilum ARMAN-2 TaxID=425595 RepID=C7DHJ9_MICA2|nr:MAG: hypothetical protein UNLARM2_0542 [Candidatus Micrarchaeum acidiphilum ARMAN-2]MCW6160672.1 hypothetical protein [Candidatus Micrarchaeales archaeon]